MQTDSEIAQDVSPQRAANKLKFELEIEVCLSPFDSLVHVFDLHTFSVECGVWEDGVMYSSNYSTSLNAPVPLFVLLG